MAARSTSSRDRNEIVASSLSAWPRSAGSRLKFLLLTFFSFFLSRAAEHAGERVVAFVAGVLVETLGRRVPRIFAGPRSVPRRRILDSEAIEERPRIDAREALDDVQVLARAAELRLVREVGRVDDERIALPMPDRVAHPFADGRRQVLR